MLQTRHIFGLSASATNRFISGPQTHLSSTRMSKGAGNEVSYASESIHTPIIP